MLLLNILALKGFLAPDADIFFDVELMDLEKFVPLNPDSILVNASREFTEIDKDFTFALKKCEDSPKKDHKNLSKKSISKKVQTIIEQAKKISQNKDRNVLKTVERGFECYKEVNPYVKLSFETFTEDSVKYPKNSSVTLRRNRRKKL